MAHLQSRPPKTVEDYLALPDDVRAELIGGDLYVTSAPSPEHQDAVLQLARLLSDHAEQMHAGRVCIAPLDVHLPTGDIVQPDVCVIAKHRLGIIRTRIEGAPDLVVEVVSPSHPERDRLVKRELYARCRVPAYWIVDTEDRSIEVLRLEGRTYAPEAYVQQGEVLATAALPGLRLPLTKVFR